MTDNTRVSDGNTAAAPKTHADSFDRTELFNSFGKTSREQSSTDTTRTSTDNSTTAPSDRPTNKSESTDNSSLRTNQTDNRQNGEANRRSDTSSGDSESIKVSDVFQELGLTRGLSNQGNAAQTIESNSNRDRSTVKGAEQLPQVSFFDSASQGASISARSDAPSQRNRGREQQPGNLRRQPGLDDNGSRRGDRVDNSARFEGTKPQNGLQVENIGASKEFANRVQKQINSLTPETRTALEKSGVEIVTTDKIVSLRPDLKGKQPYNQPGAKYENVDSFYLPNSKSIVLAETSENRAGQTVPNNRVEGVFKHEVGHALDASLGDFSQKPEFVEAHQKDIANLNPFEKNMYSYLEGSKEGDGKKETFAEVWGALNGSSSNQQESARILEKFPNVANLIKEKLPQFIKNK